MNKQTKEYNREESWLSEETKKATNSRNKENDNQVKDARSLSGHSSLSGLSGHDHMDAWD